MPINAINSYNPNTLNKQKSVINAKNTGYACVGALGLTIATSIIKNKTIRKCHLPLGIITAALAAFHWGIIEGKKP
ncbi:MAG: hypothetical protein LKG27_05250 [Clostridiaceae bacterium]|jgi:hypothetical protein|nr:hypothetical protein [Clostridiaceae bacterium]